MSDFENVNGWPILRRMVKAIQDNKGFLGEIDGLIGDGDHGMNMSKGFTLFEKRFGSADISFTDGLNELGNVLLTEIGGSMGPIYGTIFIEMADAGESAEVISLDIMAKMLQAGLDGLSDIIDAKVGDKTLVDTLSPAVDALNHAVKNGDGFIPALTAMKAAAQKGMESTKDMIAKYGRSSRLGERSRGVMDAGATSCSILLSAMADGIIDLLDQ